MACWTEWDPLEEVIVGDCFLYEDINWSLPPSTADKFSLILRETKEDLDQLANYLSQLGVKVHRPTPKHNNATIEVSNFNIKYATAPIVPRDQYLVYGDTIYQTYTSLLSRYVDSLSYYEIFLELYKQGHNWISQPPPELENIPDYDDNWINLGTEIYQEKYNNKILWHTACMFKYGDSLLSNTSPGTKLGLEWMQRNTPQGKIITQNKFGHIDHGFFSINDDVIICHEKKWVPEVLHNKKLFPVSLILNTHKDYNEFVQERSVAKEKISEEWLDRWLLDWKGYFQEVNFDFNPLVVDPNNVIFTNYQPRLFKLLESLDIKSHVCPIRHGAFWEAGIHCVTLDIKRRGECRQIIH